MKFRLYDTLVHLVPGFVVYLAYLEVTGQGFNKDLLVPMTALAFVIGYFVNAIASWFEGIFYWTWGGKPSSRMLDGHDVWKVRFYEHRKAKELLQKESSGSSKHNDALFSIAMRYATPEVNSRVSDFNANYAFSRVILMTILIASVLLIANKPTSLQVYALTVPVTIASWLRAKQRGYYYAREVLNTYLQVKESNSE